MSFLRAISPSNNDWYILHFLTAQTYQEQILYFIIDDVCSKAGIR